MRLDYKTVWYWPNGCWCDAAPGDYHALALMYGCHMGVVDAPRNADDNIINAMVDEAIALTVNFDGGG